jgi:hypothetical protein
MRPGGLSIGAALALLAVCVSLTPAPAGALEPGVHLDPASPAEKQYVLTLNQARQTGQRSSSASHSPGSGGSSGSASSSPLFGSGITPPKGGSSTGAAKPSRATPTRREGGGAAAHPQAAPAPVTLPASVLRATRSPDSGGDGSLLALLGGGLAILVIGGFGGTVLRHSRRPTPSG